MNIHYPDNLPVVTHKEAIQAAIIAHQVVIIAGDTGSGKTTQIPKFCLEALPDSSLLIGCTQPRRIAAATVASRVSEELNELGGLVGYKIRFHDYTSPATRIKFMTDGVLLAETRQDPLLRKYGVILLDEAHERSLNIDFLLGYLKRILPSRPELKLIITSATIDTEAFARHFNGAPILTVAGRNYPVEVSYLPLAEDEDDGPEGYVEHCAAAIETLAAGPYGDILAFLPTEKDIRACCILVAEKVKNAVVLPMFGRLPAEDQKKIFADFAARKIVIATNVAETSITVPGIRYVVDSGLARQSFYNPRAKTNSLPIQKISRASCDQRKGRCGRTGPGICIRLYSEEDYRNREEFTQPEIKRANLAEVILQMISHQLGRPEDFPFIDPPHRSAIRDGYRLLLELGAIDDGNLLTEHGRFMAELPIDPCISRILLEAKKRNCLAEVKIIAAALAIQDPRIRPAEKEKLADAAHKTFAHPHSDFLALLAIWHHFHGEQGDVRSWSRLKKYCKSHYLSFQRMREWLDLYEQLSRILDRQPDFIDNSEAADYGQIHRALAAGFLRNIARKKQDRIYQGAGDRELMIFPGSHQFLKSGQWILAASFLETSRLYALTVATIEPEWLEELAPHLCRYSWTDPRWQKKTGQVVADEKVTLFGLIIAAGRLVNYGLKNSTTQREARAIFIEAALLTGEIQGKYPFLDHNRQLIDHWREAEDKLRRSSILQDDATLASFYDTRLSPEVYDRSSLNRWLRQAKNQKLLYMTEADILRDKPGANELANFPTTLTAGSLQLSLTYAFAPGAEDDGVSIHIPIGCADTLNPALFDWLVPGLLPEKISFLLKGLPKGLRKHLVPIPAMVDRLLDGLQLYKGGLLQALEAGIFKYARIAVQRADWPGNLPLHLQPRFVLIGLDGQELATGRNLSQLLSQPSPGPSMADQQAAMGEKARSLLAAWQDRSTRTWDFADLPDSLPLQGPAGQVVGLLYPALVANSDQSGVLLRFIADRNQARLDNLRGIALLYRLQFAEAYKSLKRSCTTAFSGPSAHWLLEYGSANKEVIDKLLALIIRTMFPDSTKASGIPDYDTFTAHIERVRQGNFLSQGQAICATVLASLRLRREVLNKIHQFRSLKESYQVFSQEKSAEFEQLLAAILPADFLDRGEAIDFNRIDRQLRSLALRIERYHANPAKDRDKANQLAPYLASLSRFRSNATDFADEELSLLAHYAEMIDEFRISLFSPELKTRIPVSAKRLSEVQRQLAAKCGSS